MRTADAKFMSDSFLSLFIFFANLCRFFKVSCAFLQLNMYNKELAFVARRNDSEIFFMYSDGMLGSIRIYFSLSYVIVLLILGVFSVRNTQVFLHFSIM